jgi:hypothetical protein
VSSVGICKVGKHYDDDDDDDDDDGGYDIVADDNINNSYGDNCDDNG